MKTVHAVFVLQRPDCFIRVTFEEGVATVEKSNDRCEWLLIGETDNPARWEANASGTIANRKFRPNQTDAKQLAKMAMDCEVENEPTL